MLAKDDFVRFISGARHPHLPRELLDAHGADHLAERDLDRHALVHGRQEKLARELLVPEILSQSLVPVSTAPWHITHLANPWRGEIS